MTTNTPSRRFTSAAIAALALATLTAAQPPAAPPSAPATGGRGRGPGVEASVVNAARSPEVHPNHSITFRLLAPNAKSVRVLTDMPKLGEVTVHGSAGYDMSKDEKGVWSFTTPPLTPSYYQYWFVMDGLTMPDPQNTFVRPASGVYKSIVAVPGHEADFMMFRDVPHGDLIEHHYFNQEIKVARRVVVYTPPDYHTSGRNYPVVYLLHGLNDFERGWTQSGMANNIMDNLIAEGKAVPAIIVMPFGHATTGATGKQPETLALQKSLGYTPPAGGGRGVGIGGAPGWNMEKEMIDYVMPYVEKEFRVIKDKDHRAIMGYSMGGGHSTTIGFGHPELFSYVGGFSGYGSAGLLTADPAKTNQNYKMIFIGSGTEDTAVNNGRTMHATLTEKGVNHTWSEDPGYGHDYQIWRIYLHRLLQKTFRD